jgi:hypothetical protein
MTAEINLDRRRLFGMAALGVAAVEFERMTAPRGSSRIALLAPLYASDESNMHDDTWW